MVVFCKQIPLRLLRFVYSPWHTQMVILGAIFTKWARHLTESLSLPILLLLWSTYVVVELRQLIGWVAHTWHSLWLCDSPRSKIQSMEGLIETFRCKYGHRRSRLLNPVGSQVFLSLRVPKLGPNWISSIIVCWEVCQFTLMHWWWRDGKGRGWTGLDGLAL